MKDEWSDFSQYSSEPITSPKDEWSGFSQYDSGASEKKGRTFSGTVGDTGTALAKSAVSWGTGLVSLADMVTPGDLQGWMHDNLGYDPKVTQAFINDFYSIPQQEANKRVEAATGFLGTMEAYAKNPSTIATGALENITSIAGGGAIASGLKYLPTVGKLLGPVARSAIGEGSITAGQQDLQVRDAQGGKETSLKQKGLSALAGLGTGALSFGGGKVAQKFGLSDIETLLAGGSKGTRGRVAGGIGGALQEGFEELQQSMQEQALQNIATGNPISEGVLKSGAQGAVLGGVMGGGVNVISGPEQRQLKSVPDSPDVARAKLDAEIKDSLVKLDEKIAGIGEKILSGVEIYPDGTVTGTKNAPNRQKVIPPSSPPPSAGKVQPVEIYPDGTVTGGIQNPVFNLTKADQERGDANLQKDFIDSQVSAQQQDDQRKLRNQQKQLPAGQGFELVPPENQAKEQPITPDVKKQLLKEAESLVNEDPTYQIMASTKKSGGISHESMQDYPAETINQIQKRYPGLISTDGKMHIDEVADQNGMTADELVEQFKSVPTKVKLKKKIYRDLENQWQEYEFDRVAEKRSEIKNATGVEDVSREVDQIVDAVNQGVPWAQDKTIADDKRFTAAQKEKILQAQEGKVTVPEKLAKALGDSEAATNAALSGQTEEQQIGNIVDDKVKQPLDIAAIAEQKGKTELATKYREKAIDNGEKLKAADGAITEQKVNEALEDGINTVQEGKNKNTKQSRVEKPVNAQKDVENIPGLSQEKGNIKPDKKGPELGLENIEVETVGIRESTGDSISYKTNAKEAIEDIEKDIEAYRQLLECLKK